MSQPSGSSAQPDDAVAPRLGPPSRAPEPSQVAAEYATHEPAVARRGLPGVPTATASEEQPAQTQPEQQQEYLASTGGLGDAPSVPIVSLPPIAAEVGGYPISSRTGEPVRSPLIVAALIAFGASSLVALAGYWWYWWVAINIENFATSAKLIELFDPRPGSGSSVVLVCVMAVIGVVMTAGPAVAGYNAWHGQKWSKVAGLIACGTSLLAYFVVPWSWLTLLFAAIGILLLWLPAVAGYFAAWEQYNNPVIPEIVPPEAVPYGPKERYR